MTASTTEMPLVNLYGLEVLRQRLTAANKPPILEKGGISVTGSAIQFLLRPLKNQANIQVITTATKTEYWHDQSILAVSVSEDNPIIAQPSSAPNAGEPQNITQIFVNCSSESIEKVLAQGERLMILHGCDLTQYCKTFTEQTTLVTDVQTLSSLKFKISLETYDYERQVNACIEEMCSLPADSPLLKLKAIAVVLSTACVLILERMSIGPQHTTSWQGVFVYLPNLYDTAKPAFELSKQSIRYDEAFTALLLAKWLANDCEDKFNLRSIARYRLSLAFHDALLLNSMLLDTSGNADNFIKQMQKPETSTLKTMDCCSDGHMCTLLMKIRRIRDTWPHPLHVPIDDIRKLTHKPWALLPALELDGFTLARAICDLPEVKGVPILRRGKLCTLDTIEIAGAMRMEQLITKYRDSSERDPLSLAIFGSPGAGKSFFVREIIQGINEKNGKEHREIKLIIFNLSQVDFAQANTSIINVFHIVRDISLQGKLPLLFVDEFDAEGMKWIKLFLAPMQDGKFIEGTELHELPRCIIVFAGGVVSSLAKLLETEDAAQKKIPDFVSRLNATLSVKGINPDQENDPDRMYIARRALILNQNFTQQFPGCKMEDGLRYALLHVNEYHGGARAIIKLISAMSHGKNQFVHRYCLPSDTELSQYLDVASFQKQYAFGCLLYAEAKRIAPLINAKYHELQASHIDSCGYPLTYGYRSANATDTKHILNDDNQEGTLHLPGFLQKNGYEIVLRNDAQDSSSANASVLNGDELGDSLAYYEHMRWMAMRMLGGLWFSTQKSMCHNKTLTTPYFIDCETLKTLTLCRTASNTNEHSSYKLDREIALLHWAEIQKCFTIRKVTPEPCVSRHPNMKRHIIIIRFVGKARIYKTR